MVLLFRQKMIVERSDILIYSVSLLNKGIIKPSSKQLTL
nr:MAG TPA: hypothetical protein [Caudoviricetes sp.]